MNTQSAFQMHSAMRMARKSAMQRGVLAVLDIGSSKIACFILQLQEPSPFGSEALNRSIIERGNFRVIGAATTRSLGVEFGEITAMHDTERAIRKVIQGAEKMAQIRVDHVIVCMSGGMPRSYGLTGDSIVENGEVSQLDIGQVLANCEFPRYGEGREILHAQPVNFALDHRTGLADPRGQIGNRLTVDMHLLTVDERSVQNMVQCIRRCDLEIAGIVNSGYASGMSALVEDEQELGSACIDMGAGTTSVTIFMKRHMIFSEVVRMGGNHITNDISMGLHVTKAAAERLKTVHGGVTATGADDREYIDLAGNSGDWEIDRRRATRAELIGVMRPRVEEILEHARARLEAAGFEHLPSNRIVLTGGSSEIPGIEQLASSILGQQVRIGRPMRIAGLPQATTSAAFAAMVGLTLHAAEPQDECWDFDMPLDGQNGRAMRQALRWFKENW